MILKEMNILLADDDADDNYFFNEALKEFALPTKLTNVNDGEHLMKLLTSETTELPHVLFLDLNMPRKNGFECLAEIKQNEKLKNIPVIIYSTSFHKKISDILYQNGANYYISKPAEISQLKKAIINALTLLTQENIQQPSLDNFVLTKEKRNYQTFFWFNKTFVIPFKTKNVGDEF